MALLYPAGYQFHDSNGDPVASGSVYFYETGTETLKAIYTDKDLSVAAANPFSLDASGRFTGSVSIFGSGDYTVTVKDSTTATVFSRDSIFGWGDGTPYFERTAAEIAAGVTPVAGGYQYEPGNVLRYGADSTGVSNCDAAFSAAITGGGGKVWVPAGTYLISSEVTITTDNVWISGVPGASILQQSGNVVVFYVQSSNVKISGLSFYGDQAGSSSRTNLLIIGGSGKTPDNVEIEGCHFVESSSSCILIGGDLATCSNVMIHHNTMTDYWENAVDCVTAGQQRIKIHHNIAVSSVVHPNGAVSRPIGFAMEPQSAATTSDYEVSDNIVDFSGISVPNRNTTVGVYVGEPSIPPANFTLKRAIIARNIIRGVGRGVDLAMRWGTTTDSATVNITDNIIEAARNEGILVDGGDDATYGDSLTISNNTIKGWSEATSNLYDGIYLSGYIKEPIIAGNIIMRRLGETGAANGRYGVNIDSANILAARIWGNNIVNAQSGDYADTSGQAVIQDDDLSTSVLLSGDNQLVEPKWYKYIQLTSDNATASNRTFTLASGRYTGQRVLLHFESATNACEYVDNSTASDGAVARLNGNWTPTEDDCLEVVWTAQGEWAEVSRSAN